MTSPALAARRRGDARTARDRASMRRRSWCTKGRPCSSRASAGRCAPTSGPGCTGSCPWPIDQASWLDMRRRVYEGGHTEMLTRDKKNVIVRTFVVWRIERRARVRAVDRRAGRERRKARRPAHQCRDLRRSASTTCPRSCRRIPRTCRSTRSSRSCSRTTAPAARTSYGVEIEQIRLERIALPEENVQRGLRADARGAAPVRREVPRGGRARGEPHPLRGGPRGGADPRPGRGAGGAHPRPVGGRGREDLRRRAPRRSRRSTASRARSSRSTSWSASDTSLILRTDAEPFSLLQSQDAEVRRTAAPSELGRLAAPLARLLDAAWQRMHWWIARDGAALRDSRASR